MSCVAFPRYAGHRPGSSLPDLLAEAADIRRALATHAPTRRLVRKPARKTKSR